MNGAIIVGKVSVLCPPLARFMDPKLFYPLVWTKSKLKTDCSLRGRHTTWHWNLHSPHFRVTPDSKEICTCPLVEISLKMFAELTTRSMVYGSHVVGCLTGAWTRGCRKWTVESLIHPNQSNTLLFTGSQTWSTRSVILMHLNVPLCTPIQAESPRLDITV